MLKVWCHCEILQARDDISFFRGGHVYAFGTGVLGRKRGKAARFAFNCDHKAKLTSGQVRPQHLQNTSTDF